MATPKSFDVWLIDRLTEHGAYTGNADGAHGRAVIAALERYQSKSGLPVTGKADTATVQALRLGPDDPVVPPAEPEWMREARRYMGLKEIAGARSDPIILGWAKAIGGWVASYYTDDDIPWCGLFVAHIIGATLPREVLPANPLSALAWAGFGRRLEVPAVGAILVFSREGGGHVGLYVGETQTAYRVLGGNQLNSVSLTWVAKQRLVDGGIRWPSTVTPPIAVRVLLKADGSPLSTNEA